MTEQLVAITGATGFLGRHVLDAVHQSGYRAVAVVRDAVSAQNHLPGDIEIRQADVMDAGAMEKAFRGVSSAIHLAGMVSVSRRDNQAVTEVNVTGARNFLMAVKRCGASRILFTSTTSAVAALSCDRPEQASDETAVFNLGHEPVAYIRAKRQAHELALDARRNGLPVTILSPSLVLGPGDINSNSSELVDAVRKRALPVCPPGGVNPIDVRDIARAYVAALRHPDPAPHYILASQDNMSLKKFISRVATLSGVSPPRFSLPGPVILSCDRPEQASDETAVFNLGHEPVAYIRAKRQAHELALDARRNGLPVTILSPSLVLGPGDINSNSSELVDAVRKRALPVCPPGGVNPIDVRDIARAYVAALRHPDPAPHYILASQDNMSLKKFISRVATLSGVSPPRFSLPGPVILFMATMVEAMAPAGSLTVAGARLGNYHWYFDGALARRDLSLDCRPLDDTLWATLDWLMAKENQIENKISQ